MFDPKKFREFLSASADAKDGYIMCAIGQDPKKLNKWYFDQYKDNSRQYKKALYWKEHAAHVYDCQGLVDCFVGINVRARNNYASWCETKGNGKIPDMYKVQGAAVFIHNGSYISHVGFLEEPVDPSDPDGDWIVIEARGVMYGVVRTKLSNRDWNRWGLMDAADKFDYSEVLAERGVKTDRKPAKEQYVLGSRLLKRGCKGEDVRMLQELLIKIGYEEYLAKYGADGEFGKETETALKSFQKAEGLEVDGKYGEESHAALMDAIDEEKEELEQIPQAEKKVTVFKSGTWRVRKGPGKEYATYTYTKQGAEFPYVSTAENGWLQVEVNGAYGWISPVCAEVK